MRLKSIAVNAALIIISVLLTFAALEYLVFPRILTHVPLKHHFSLRPELRLLTQVSKDSVVPEKYLAIFGDSYAQGYGDWLLDADVNDNPPFHSAHVLHDKLNRDIISFGKSGSSNLQGYVGNPISWLNYLKNSRFAKLGNPDEIIIYFYEGNDLNDNLMDLKLRYIERGYSTENLYDEKSFKAFIEKEIVRNDGKVKPPLFSEFYLVDFIASMIKGPDGNGREEVIPFKVGNINRAIVDGKEINMPDGLHSPSMELSLQEIHLGVYIFRQSLAYMLGQFPGIKVSMVYIPAVLACYDISSTYASFQPYNKGRDTVTKSELIFLRSDKIFSMVRAVAQDLGVQVIVVRPALRKAAKAEIIHGPKDWKHLNKLGYHVMADAIIKMRQRAEANGSTRKKND